MIILKRRFSIANNKFKSLIKASLTSQQHSSGLDTVAEDIKSIISDMFSLKELSQFKDIEDDFNWLYGQILSVKKSINKKQLFNVSEKKAKQVLESPSLEKPMKVPVSVSSDKPIMKKKLLYTRGGTGRSNQEITLMKKRAIDITASIK